MKIRFNISAIKSYNIRTIDFQIVDSDKRNIAFLGKQSQVYFFKRKTFFFNNDCPTLKLSFEEKIQHVVNRISLYESGNMSDNFKDLDETTDLEYTRIFFDIITMLSCNNFIVPKKIITVNKYIGVFYVDLIRINAIDFLKILNDEQVKLVLKSTQSFKRADK